MAVLNQDTRLIMTILFVGAVSGANVYAYAEIGTGFPYGALAHSVLFGLGTIGAIMVMKALFDLALNDKIEFGYSTERLLLFGKEKARDDQQRRKMVESAKQYNTSLPYTGQTETDDNTVGNEFLAVLQ